MNHDQVSGKWSQIKGHAKKVWGGPTDDEFSKADGSVEKLCGVTQVRFGDSRAALQSKFNAIDEESRNAP